MMDIRPLKGEADYESALAEIEKYFDHEPEPGTRDADRFDLLALVIGDYEARHWAIDAPDAPDALRERMDTRGLTQQDLARVLGSRSRASEVMNRRRHLTLEQVWKLHREWNIPADALIRPYPLKPDSKAAVAGPAPLPVRRHTSP
ncbi:MAG: helix-turn-helix domain-containing protein [Azospirillaceae bacterium]|nr:helix-turn-helix domain-containing protein [Azospirillaceae bacterium]